MVKKRKLRVVLSVFLLICFSAVSLPFDLFHDHSAEEAVCKDVAKGECSHKLHLSQKKASCWLCTFHIDKNFTATKAAEQSHESLVVRILTENKVFGFVFTRLLTFLRGPPAI